MSGKQMSSSQKNSIAPHAKDIDLTKLKFKPPVVNKHGAPRVDINGPTVFQLPLARTPFGVNHYTWDKKPVVGTRKNMSLECSDEESVEFFTKLDNLMIDMGCAHPEWFKKKKSISRDAVETFYRKCLQESKGDYPPSVRVKVIEGESEGNNTIIREVYTAEGDSEESYDIGNSYNIVPNTDVMCVIRIASVWFVARHDFAQHCFATKRRVCPAISPCGLDAY